MTTPVSATELADLVCVERGRDVAAQQCCEALRSGTFAGLVSSAVPIEHLRRIYRVRLEERHSSADLPLGADDLLSRLDAYQGRIIEMVVWERDTRVYCLLLDEARQRVVSCMVGRDRRFIPDTP